MPSWTSGATASEIERPWACSESSKSHTVVPSRTEPARGTAPAEASSVSTSVVFPEPPGPTTHDVSDPVRAARLQILAGWSPGASLVRHRATSCSDQRQLLFARSCKGYPGTVRVTTLSVMSRVVGRVTLLAQARHLLAEGVSVALDGPPGIGKSALLDALESSVDALVLRASGAPTEQSMPYAALQDLIDQLPADLAAAVPDALRPYGEAGLVGAARAATTCGARSAAPSGPCSTSSPPTAAGCCSSSTTRTGSTPTSACVLGYARRRLVGRVARGRHRRSRLRHRHRPRRPATCSTYPRSTPAT